MNESNSPGPGFGAPDPDADGRAAWEAWDYPKLGETPYSAFLAGFRIALEQRTVPRVATSLDDLRVGQWAACWQRDYGTEIEHPEKGEVWFWNAFLITKGQLAANWSQQDWSKVIILEDPPPEPVPVPRELVDALAEALNSDDRILANTKTALIAAHRLVDAVRGTE